jgi:uncharacterized protein with HEPN domain
MDRQTRKLLRDAYDATGAILDDTRGLDLQGFLADRTRQRATYYAFAVLGEALNQVQSKQPDLIAALPDVRPAIDMRNRLIHGYASVDAGIVWATIQADIPIMRDELRALLEIE